MIKGDLAASLAAHSATAASNSPAGTTLLTSPPQRLLRRPALAEQQQLVGLLARNVAVDEGHDHEREGADVDLGRAERGRVGGHDQVARKRDAESSGEHVTARRARVGLPRAPISLNSDDEALGAEVLVHERTSAAKPPRLAPEEKTFSCEEASTTKRTASSSRARSKLDQPSKHSAESALRVAGSFSVIVATPSATS